jgi:hypothetical protein
MRVQTVHILDNESELARRARVSRNTIRRFKAGDPLQERTRAAVLRALAEADAASPLRGLSLCSVPKVMA